MNLTSCPYEKEVRRLMGLGQWPDACPAELRAHVRGCRWCSDLVLVTEAFHHARANSVAVAQPVAPAVLLWRAQLRRRNAAVERIGRPLLGAQIFACAVALVAAVGFAGMEARNGAAWLTWSYWHDWFAQLPQAAAAQWAGLGSGALAGSAWSWVVLVPALTMVVLLGGVAVYFATDKQ